MLHCCNVHVYHKLVIEDGSCVIILQVYSQVADDWVLGFYQMFQYSVLPSFVLWKWPVSGNKCLVSNKF